MNLEFSRQIFENNQISNSMKILHERTDLFHADGWTDRRTDETKLIVAFRNFAKALKNNSKLMGILCYISVAKDADKNNRKLRCFSRILR